MGLLDFLSQQGAPSGGLLDFLRTMPTGLESDRAQYGQQPMQQPTAYANNQPSPLDNAQWPAGPQGAPSQAMAFAPQQQPMQPQPVQQSMPQSPGIGDRLMAGIQSFANSGSPLQAIAGGISGLATGQRADPEGMALQKQALSQKAIYDAVLQQPDMTPQKAFIIATNPKAFDAYSAQLLDKKQYGFTTLPDGTVVSQDPMTGKVSEAFKGNTKTIYAFTTAPDGTVLRQNPQTGSVEPAYNVTPKADWGIVDEQDGKKVYGWIDKNKREVTPSAAAEPAKTSITGPDGKPIEIPAGVDRKTFINEVSRAGAKAAAGEKTEVQAKSEKFGNKMELAEKNLKSVEDEGTGYMGRALDNAPLVGGTMATNWLQSDGYQKYRQARDNFITALLRDESGAAIGTSEFQRYEKELFPQPGDGPKNIEQKREARAVAVEAMKKSAGPGYKSPTFESSKPKGEAPGAGAYMWMPGKGLVPKS